MTIDRRRFLKRSGLGAIGAAAALSGGGVADGAESVAGPATGVDATLASVAFEGLHQAGIVTPAPAAASFAALDVTVEDRAGLADLFRTLTSRARFLTAGGVPPRRGTQSPPADSGTLGPRVPADALTVTLGVSSRLFDSRFGLAARRPLRLTEMKDFPNDALLPQWLGGDMLLQLCAGSGDTVLHALRDIARHTRGAMAVRWRIDGSLSPPRPSGVPRNHLGFMDGIANPAVRNPKVADQLLWVVAGHGEPDWAVGGSYHVIRLIRMDIESWDRLSLHAQQTTIGRYRADGAPLGMSEYTDVPDYGKDPLGHRVPLHAHIRLANPRTTGTEPSIVYRRGYNYDLGTDARGNLDMGLIFNCFQQDPIRQFEATQTRLVNEPLAAFISPFGGGFFFALPGVRNAQDWLGRGLLQA